MPDFSFEALTEQGTVTRGAAVAEDERALEGMLRMQGRYLIRAEPVPPETEAPGPEARAAPAAPRAGARTDGQINRKEMLAFTEYLWSSSQAGIPILTTLADLEAQLDSKRLRAIAAELRASMVEEGKGLSEAMAEHPKAFPRLYVATVEAGEITGQLDYALSQLVDYLEWQQEISNQIRQATLYPVIVLMVMAALVVLLVAFVYPRLLPIFAGFDVELPLPTRVIMATGSFLRSYWALLVAASAAGATGWWLAGRTPRGRLAIDTFKLRVPIFGPLLHQIEMARLVTYMGLFYRTGVDLLRGLSLLEQMMNNQRVARAVREARLAIAGGESIARALSSTGLFPSVVVRSFALGESTGKLDESLARARAFYAREVPAAVRRMLAALQPLMILVLGGLIGVVAMSIFLPILSIYQAIGP